MKMNFFVKVTVVMIVISIDKVVGSGGLQELERMTINSLLKGYDPTIRPSAGKNGTGPVEVEVNTYVRNIGNFDDIKTVYEAQLTLRQSWRDDRLKYDGNELNYITLTREGTIWVPDLFFSNEDSGHTHDIIKPNFLIRIDPNGQVLYSTRISLRLFCKMNLHNYPLDSQVCNIILASYGYTTENLVFHWKNANAIQLTRSLASRKFKLNAYSKGNCTSNTTTGEYSCLKMELYLSRYFQHYYKDVYIPTTSLVLLSFVVFWLNPKHSNIRFGIWIGSLITMYMLMMSINFKVPETPYTKALDVWTGSCLTFVYFIVLELCLVKNASENVDDFSKQNKLTNDDFVEEGNSMKLEDPKIRKQIRNYCAIPLKWYNSYSTKAQRIDVICRIIFPLTFFIFMFFYWIAYYANQCLCEGENCTILI